MNELNIRMNPLSSSACVEMKERYAALGITLEGEQLMSKTLEYLKVMSKYVTNGVQYFTAKELAWEEVS